MARVYDRVVGGLFSAASCILHHSAMSVLRRPVKFNLALRVGLLLMFVLAVEWPGEPLVTLGPQQRVATNNPKAGVHTRLTDEGAIWKIQRNLQLVREMGAPWIVEFFPWAYIEHSKDTFDWWHTDQVIDHARTQGLKVIARLGLVPAWARPDPLDQETTLPRGSVSVARRPSAAPLS